MDLLRAAKNASLEITVLFTLNKTSTVVRSQLTSGLADVSAEVLRGLPRQNCYEWNFSSVSGTSYDIQSLLIFCNTNFYQGGEFTAVRGDTLTVGSNWLSQGQWIFLKKARWLLH